MSNISIYEINTLAIIIFKLFLKLHIFPINLYDNIF